MSRTSAATDQTRLWDGLRRFDGNEMETLQSADKLDDFGYDRCGEQTTGDTGKDKAKGNDLADEDSEDRVVLAELKRLADYGSDSESSDASMEDDDALLDACNDEIDDEGTSGYKVGGYHPVSIGEVYDERYTVVQKLGWGHFSTVWMVHDAVDSRKMGSPRFYAMKVQKSAEHYTEAALDEIKLLTCISNRELELADAARVCAEDTHLQGDSHCVRLTRHFTHAGPHGEHTCMVFEILGCNTLTLIRRFNYRGIPLNLVRSIVRQICLGLDFLHRKCEIIHTDLKPENVLLDLKVAAPADWRSLVSCSRGGDKSESGKDAERSVPSTGLKAAKGSSEHSIEELEFLLQKEGLDPETRRRLRKKLKKKKQKQKQKAKQLEESDGKKGVTVDEVDGHAKKGAIVEPNVPGARPNGALAVVDEAQDAVNNEEVENVKLEAEDLPVPSTVPPEALLEDPDDKDHSFFALNFELNEAMITLGPIYECPARDSASADAAASANMLLSAVQAEKLSFDEWEPPSTPNSCIVRLTTPCSRVYGAFGTPSAMPNVAPDDPAFVGRDEDGHHSLTSSEAAARLLSEWVIRLSWVYPSTEGQSLDLQNISGALEQLRGETVPETAGKACSTTICIRGTGAVDEDVNPLLMLHSYLTQTVPDATVAAEASRCSGWSVCFDARHACLILGWLEKTLASVRFLVSALPVEAATGDEVADATEWALHDCWSEGWHHPHPSLQPRMVSFQLCESLHEGENREAKVRLPLRSLAGVDLDCIRMDIVDLVVNPLNRRLGRVVESAPLAQAGLARMNLQDASDSLRPVLPERRDSTFTGTHGLGLRASLDGEASPSEDSEEVAKAALAKASRKAQKRQSRDDLLQKLRRVRVAIVDLGNACWRHRHFTEDIQTRQYRSPEVILGQGYDTSADIWSLGCMAFELMTGDLLFEPKNGENYSRDEDHLAQCIELLGKFPKKMMREGTNAREFFSSKGELRHIHHLKMWPLEDVLQQKYYFDKNVAIQAADFLRQLLHLRPDERVTAAKALEHPFLRQDPQDEDGVFEAQIGVPMAAVLKGLGDAKDIGKESEKGDAVDASAPKTPSVDSRAEAVPGSAAGAANEPGNHVTPVPVAPMPVPDVSVPSAEYPLPREATTNMT
mmetsp:Transcript_12880/g.47669  ORF Transcript_12880/g.47669 Transcript_12880/m.47669 type:complete len:1139 (-) Transcript_12880:404-3820(-)